MLCPPSAFVSSLGEHLPSVWIRGTLYEYRWSLTYNDPAYDFLTSRWCGIYTPSEGTLLQLLNVDLFPG